jgi:putative peptidoglycan lipid II flippase
MNRVKKFWYYISDRKLTIGNAVVILGTTGLISNILGLYRERLIAGHFGAGSMTDAFYASFRLPDLIFNLLILGALSSAFIPVFVEKLSKNHEEEAQHIANSFLNFITLAALVSAVILFILAPKFVPFLFPGFFNRPATPGFNIYQVTVNLTRIMMISPILFAISGVFGGILISYKRFVAYSLAPLIYNISIILSIIFLTSKFNPPIYALTVGVIGGALLSVLIQLPSVLATGFRWKPELNFKEGEIARIIKLMLPRTLALGTSSINLYIDTFIASFFVGGITVINFANDIQTAPTVIFGIAIATAIFPVLSEAIARNNMSEFMSSFSWSARRILYFTIPATVGIIVLRAQIIRLIFGIGNFSWNNTYWTTKALLFFSLGLVAQGLIPLLLKAFYAIQDTKTPLYIALFVMVLNAILSLTLPFIAPLGLGIAGIALAFSIAGIVNAILLFIWLHGKIGALDPDHKIFESTSRLILASLLMGLISYGSLYFFNMFVDTSHVIGLFLQTMGAVSAGGISYFLFTWVFKCEEVQFILDKIGLKRKVNDGSI